MLARIQITETEWDQLLADWQTCVDTESCSLPDEIQTLLRNGQAREIEAQSPVGFILVDVIGSEPQIDALIVYFSQTDIAAYWKWNYNGKVDFETEYTGQQDDILATQPSNTTYDAQGSPTGSTSATFEDANWVHGWAGQGENRFAREFSREFGEEFA